MKFSTEAGRAHFVRCARLEDPTQRAIFAPLRPAELCRPGFELREDVLAPLRASSLIQIRRGENRAARRVRRARYVPAGI